MGKYDRLKKHLENSIEKKVVLTFQEIKNILGFLPDSAYTYVSWWANGDQTQQKAWGDAGWEVESPTDAFINQEVTFCKAPPMLHEIFKYFECPHPPFDENKLKEAYKKMLKQYDPSKLKNMDMAQELIELAEKKTKEINDMYKKAESHFNAALAHK